MKSDNRKIYKCVVCGTEHYGLPLEDECPYCQWMESYMDNEQDYDSVNFMSIAEAKAKLAKGLNIWGKPLPKIRPQAK